MRLVADELEVVEVVVVDAGPGGDPHRGQRERGAGELQGRRIVVPEAVVAELEAQANHGRDIGLRGLEELRRLSELAKNGKIELEYVGIRPNLDQIKLAGGGEIDAMIRDVALELGASFLTSDQVTRRR